MASLPTFDPAKYWNYSNDLFKNPVISDAFEPGSILKPVVMASALDGNFVEPDTKCDICSGPLMSTVIRLKLGIINTGPIPQWTQ